VDGTGRRRVLPEGARLDDVVPDPRRRAVVRRGAARSPPRWRRACPCRASVRSEGDGCSLTLESTCPLRPRAGGRVRRARPAAAPYARSVPPHPTPRRAAGATG
jgi:hypothetical protein